MLRTNHFKYIQRWRIWGKGCVEEGRRGVRAWDRDTQRKCCVRYNIDNQMYSCIWGPSIHALTVITAFYLHPAYTAYVRFHDFSHTHTHYLNSQIWWELEGKTLLLVFELLRATGYNEMFNTYTNTHTIELPRHFNWNGNFMFMVSFAMRLLQLCVHRAVLNHAIRLNCINVGILLHKITNTSILYGPRNTLDTINFI